MTITEFLTARLDEDERIAKRAADGPWTVEVWRDAFSVRSAWRPSVDASGNESGGKVCDEVVRGGATVPGSHDNVTFVARFDSARVLADVAAKRATVEWAMRATVADQKMLAAEGAPDPGPPYMGDPFLHALAAVYADHADYDEGWRP